ncbi:GHKL domain-containing protein [Lachnotalea glycerini]|uniref:ATP-binding protein n=1 Tax=Lachnotalea glycerini TaxID=1763509 RepID=A0A255I3X9_9FIRM|nr:sensor histidine kinase [Lachnotalea glycerini]PXV93811.1 GHKL domain-containing protein [Lachnotalea glycerini]RDY30946.1 ATP-binding protein [Lachnotalea glycerini]
MYLYLQSFLIVVLETFCCKIFFEAFGDKRSKHNVWKYYGQLTLMIFIIYLSAVYLADFFIIKQVLVISFIALVFYNYINVRIKTAVVLSVLFQSLLLVGDYLSYSIIKVLSLNNCILERHYLTSSNLVIVVCKISLFLLVIAIKKNISNVSTEILGDWEWLRFLFFPIFTIGTITAMISSFGTIENQKQANVLIIIALGLIGMNITVFYLVADIIERELKIHQNNIFEMQVKNQTSMYQSISENFDKQKRKTHEYKNQIICIESLIRNKKYSELECYVKEIGGNLSRELDAIDTNNVIVNAILNTKYQEAIEKNIVFVFKINDLSKIQISDEDLVIILSNLLNNALEACERCIDKRILKLKLIMEEDNIIISVKNTYQDPIDIDNGEIKTTKWEHKEEHGNGIKNIIITIEKYNGSYIINNNQNEFYFSIIIPSNC